MRLPEAYEDKQKNSGFTLIETMIVVSITIIIAAVVFPLYGGFQTSGQINDASSQIAQNLKIAKQKSVAGFNDSRHGVYFYSDPVDNDYYVLYQGNTYPTRVSEYDIVITLEETITVSTDIVGNDISFYKGSGSPSTEGTITLNGDAGKVKSITVNNLGYINEN